jgi:DNA polymerase III alpha subunit
VEAPCINRSGYLTGIFGKEIVIGFIHLKSLESKWAHRIVEERQRGEYVSLDNFIRRVPMGLEQLRILIRIGALRCTGRSRQELLWEAMLYFGQSQASRQLTPLFEDPPMSFSLPTLSRTFAEDAFDEIELLGFPLCDPFLLVDTTDFGTVRARELLAVVGQRVSVVGYLVTTKDTRTKKGERMHFGTFYDCEGQVFDTTHFPREAARYPFRGRGFYRIVGKVVLDFGYPMIEVSSMDKLPMVQKLGVAAEKWSLMESAKQGERG